MAKLLFHRKPYYYGNLYSYKILIDTLEATDIKPDQFVEIEVPKEKISIKIKSKGFISNKIIFTPTNECYEFEIITDRGISFRSQLIIVFLGFIGFCLSFFSKYNLAYFFMLPAIIMILRDLYFEQFSDKSYLKLKPKNPNIK